MTNSGTATTDVDAINRCMAQTAWILQVCSIGYSWLPNHEDTYPLHPYLAYFFDRFTVRDQHKMVKMYEFWQAEKSGFVEVRSELWPVASKAAFTAYTHYLSPVKEHAQYWDQYMQLCWDIKILRRKNNLRRRLILSVIFQAMFCT